VVVGVGHETDIGIADFAADLRAATPTAAAELVTAAYMEWRERAGQLAVRLRRAMERRVESAAQRLDRAATRLTHPRQRLEASRMRLTILEQALRSRLDRRLGDGRSRLAALQLRLSARRPTPEALTVRLNSLAARLQRATRQQLDVRQARLTALQQHLAHLDPRGVLARGYTITRDAHGRIARNADALTPGSAIRIEFADGEVGATVDPRQDRLDL
jgi:exodeoxyribonuclease VII large subunit